jgi:release factor glutamine methyltransferase
MRGGGIARRVTATSALPGHPAALRVRALPGVWRPHSDAAMIANLLAVRGLAADADVLDMFTGSGVLAVAAGRLGARSVTAVDVSRRALASARLNAWRNGVTVTTRRGNLFGAVPGETFDLVLANPPYYPSEAQRPGRGISRAWEGGAAGRLLIDPLCAQVAARLRPGGRLLLVHATFNGERESLDALEATGLRAEVVHRHRGSLGRVGRSLLAQLREHGLEVNAAGEPEEETIIIAATRAGD